MAIAEMEKLELTFKSGHLDETLQLIQRFNGVQIETGLETTIPQDKRAILDKEIRTIERNLQEIRAAIHILKGRESAKTLSMLKGNEEKRLSIAQLSEIVESSNWKQVYEEVIHTDRCLQDNRQRRHEINESLDALKIWEPLNCNPLDFEKLNRAKAVFGSVHEKHAAEFAVSLSRFEEDGSHFEQVTIHADRVYFLIVYHTGLSQDVGRLLNEFSFSSESYPFNAGQAAARAKLKEEEASLLAEEAGIIQLVEVQSVYDEILLYAEDYNLNMLLRRKKALEVLYDGDNVTINGWILSEKRRLFETALSESIPAEDYTLIIRRADENDIGSIPIKLKNNRFVSIYERLTSMYSLPRYNELDPTPVMTVFYLLFFGLMVADIGYGLAVFLVGIVARRILKVKRSTRGFMDFLFYLSFPIMAWGFVYGSFFGMEIYIGLITVRTDVIKMTILSIALGYLHIMTGLVLNMINQIRLKKYTEMMTGGLCWFLAFLGGGIMILENFVPFLRSSVLFVTGLLITAIGGAMIILVPAIAYGKRWYAGVGKGLYTLYGATSYLGDFVSYTRLMALGVAGASVANAFNTILDFLPFALKVTLGVVLAVALHALNIFLSMLSAYVHGIRLQFIEFFNKFYTGGGRPFEPFKAAEKNVIITDIMADKNT